MKINNHLRALLATGIITLGSLAPVGAFNQGNSVTMNGEPIFSITSSAEGFSPEKRAWQAQDALDNALFLSSNPGPECVSVNRCNGAFTLRVNGRYVATADSASSANQGLTAQGLAEKWADSLRSALSDSERTQAYIATLKDPNKVEGEVIAQRVERRMFAPQGTVLPVAFDQNLNAANLIDGEKISGRVLTNVPLGNYVIPADSVLIGKIDETSNGVYSIRIDTLRTPNGTEVPVAAVVSDRVFSSPVAPHPVVTLAIPANSTTSTRVPAQIGIGTGRLAPVTALTFTRESDFKISQGEPANVVIEKVSSVAVVPGRGGM